jgi:hypothetical protein
MLRRALRVRNVIVLSTAILFSTAVSGCFGPFPAVSGVYGFNKSAASSRIVQSLLMVAMVIIPVYEVASLIDILVLNVVDFFKGGGSIASKTETLADGSVVELTRVDADTVHVRRVDTTGREEAFDLVRVGDNAGFVRRADGKMLGMVEALPDGRLVHRAQ